MDRHAFAQSRMLLRYDDGSTLGTCSIHCTAMELALNRIKIVEEIYAADYTSKKLIKAGKAFWIIGGSKAGVMTSRAKWAFEKKNEAEDFRRLYGGEIAAYDNAMKAAFQDMYTDIKLIRQKSNQYAETLRDIKDHPKCKYCGMKRESFAFSRMLIKYANGQAVGTCSIHCASIDLSLNTDKVPEAILVGDYDTKRLIDVTRAIWVVGGKKVGIMSIRGKWAFENRTAADLFVRENGGQISSFDDAMKINFEDMYEILN